MTSLEWMPGAAVLKLLDSAADPQAARSDLDNAIRLGTAHVRCGSRIIARNVGGNQIMAGGSLPPKLWARARAAHPGDAIWRSATLKLPATAKEAAVELVGVEFDERQVREVLTRYGLPALPPAPTPKQPKPRSGGHNMTAHGAVISAMTIDLLGLPLHEVVRKSEKVLAADLGKRFDEFKAKRESIGEENRLRMARSVQANVIAELERRAAAK